MENVPVVSVPAKINRMANEGVCFR